ncbi:MAG: phospho-N-acetylmuramoyl-pentapeptide-transferase [Clostridia bacterium]|nr:phospho-N-acetylmuramoyl-pentapeptide-transferase [Clostridia bacterium]
MKLTVGIIFAIVLGFFISFLLGFVLIPWLRKLKFGQTILDIGPAWHKSKQGTPVMGGIMFIVSTVVTFAAVMLTDYLLGGKLLVGDSLVPNSMKIKIFAGIIMAFGFGLIGFADDYIKVAKKRNLGLTITQKSVAQIALMLAYLGALYMSGNTYMQIPFAGNVDLKWFFWFFGMGVIYLTVNAVNFTDGVDGLCASVTATAAIGFIVIAVLKGFFGVSILAASLAGACAGYLIWNWHPSKVMMGDTGSMFLGGMVVALAYAIDAPLIILFIGIIYVIEMLSDLLQIGYFKATHGKRIFKMAPIHHHFEMCGWKEVKIVIVFSLINIIGCIVGVALFYFGAK